MQVVNKNAAFIKRGRKKSSAILRGKSQLGDLTQPLLSALRHLDETHSVRILFACIHNSHLLLHFDRFAAVQRRPIWLSGLD